MKTQYTTAATLPEKPALSSNEINFTQIFENVPNYGEPPVVLGSNQHQSLWEHGQIDYTGRDSFANILSYLNSNLDK